jgi:hypothetical protein
MLDFDNLTPDFVLEDALREDFDGSVSRQLIDHLELARIGLKTTSLDSEKQELMNNALLASKEVIPEIWELLHPSLNWQ